MSRRYILFPLLAIASLLMACGADGDESATGDTTASGSTAAATTAEATAATTAEATPAAADSAAATAAASGGSGGGGSPCTVFTAEELTQFAGHPYGGSGLDLGAEGVAADVLTDSSKLDLVGPDAEGCQWMSEDGLDWVQLATMSVDAFDAEVARLSSIGGFEELQGAGDRAYTFEGPNGWTAHAVDGEVSVLVQLTISDIEEDRRDASIELLDLALERR